MERVYGEGSKVSVKDSLLVGQVTSYSCTGQISDVLYNHDKASKPLLSANLLHSQQMCSVYHMEKLMKLWDRRVSFVGVLGFEL